MENRPVKMSDIADALSVSIVTVSKVLNDKEGVGNELRLKIKKLAQSMGYVQKPKNNSSTVGEYTIGIIVAEHFIKPSHSYYWTLYQSLVECFKLYGFYTLFEIIKTEDISNNIPPITINNININGLIILGHMDKNYLCMLQKHGYPMVILDSYGCNVPNSTSIITDSYTGTFRLTNYLYDMGHRSIGFVGSINEGSNIQDKYFGYRKGLMSNGLFHEPSWTIEDRNNWSFKTEFNLPKTMPTAFVCNCDETAYHFINYLNTNGYNVPQDISVIGFYNYIYATLCTPPLTTMEVDITKVAKITAKTILKLMKKEKNPEVMTISCDMIIRQSVQKLTL